MGYGVYSTEYSTKFNLWGWGLVFFGGVAVESGWGFWIDANSLWGLVFWGGMGIFIAGDFMLICYGDGRRKLGSWYNCNTHPWHG